MAEAAMADKAHGSYCTKNREAPVSQKKGGEVTWNLHSTLDHTLLYIPVVHRVVQHTNIARINITGFVEFNSLTPKSVLAGTKNSCSEGFG